MIILTAMSEESALEMTRMPALLASLIPVPLFILVDERLYNNQS